jgi:hypothetical protein
MNIHVQFGAFFSETTNMIKAKLYMNVHWMVLYKPCVFCSDIKFLELIEKEREIITQICEEKFIHKEVTIDVGVMVIPL